MVEARSNSRNSRRSRASRRSAAAAPLRDQGLEPRLGTGARVGREKADRHRLVPAAFEGGQQVGEDPGLVEGRHDGAGGIEPLVTSKQSRRLTGGAGLA